MRVVKVQSIASYKATNNVDKIDVVKAKSGKLYIVLVSGQAAMFAKDTTLETAQNIVEVANDAGETWSFVAGAMKPKEVVGAL